MYHVVADGHWVAITRTLAEALRNASVWLAFTGPVYVRKPNGDRVVLRG